MVRLTRTHSSFTLEEGRRMSRDKLTKMIPSSIITCQDHIDQQLDFYCEECAIPVCVKCTIIKHKDHLVAEVSQQVNKNKEAVCHNLKGLQVHQQKLKEVLISGEEVKEKIKAHKNEVDKMIRQTFANLQQLLHQREEALLAQSKEIANTKEAHLSLQLEGIQHLLQAITHCHSLATTSIGEYNDVELLSVAHTLQTRTNQLQQQFSETSLELCESPSISVDINTDELVTKIANVGIVFDVKDIPSQVEVGKELNVKVTYKGGGIVSGSFIPVRDKRAMIKVKTTDCGDGNYIVSLVPKQIGQHKLSVTVDGLSIQGSPFNVTVRRDYASVNKPAQIITRISNPSYIAFSDNGDMFVTSFSNHCVYVYDSSGIQKTTFGSYGTGPLQFNSPSGIAINGDIIYVAEHGGNRIQKITLEGRFLGTIGSEGVSNKLFQHLFAVCIGPDGKIYVAEYSNNCIQVFHRDETFSHIIDGNGKLQGPEGLSFDISGNLHVTSYNSHTIIVLTPEGQYIRQYGSPNLLRPAGIAIDPAGYSFVVNSGGNSLTIFDPSGNYVNSIKQFYLPKGVAIAPDESVWVADQYNDRLVKY